MYLVCNKKYVIRFNLKKKGKKKVVDMFWIYVYSLTLFIFKYIKTLFNNKALNMP